MFTAAGRNRTRDELIAFALKDFAIIGAAIVGSAARDAEDEWSDIDLALQLADDAHEPAVVERWTSWMAQAFSVADTFDVTAGGVRYRVFLLPSSLQIDVSFWPREQFRATEPGFRLLFGEANAPLKVSPPRPDDAIGMGWLYALHARSAIARENTWQAVMMLDHLRDAIFTLQCFDLELRPSHGRDVDKLPKQALQRIADARARNVTTGELSRSLQMYVVEFLDATGAYDEERRHRLTGPLRLITESLDRA